MIDPNAQWRHTRFSACWRAGLTYTARDARTGNPVGSARFTITQEISLDPNSTNITENASLLMVAGSASGVVTTMLASWTASCNSLCSTTDPNPFSNSSPIAGGETLSGDMAYSNPQTKGVVDSFQTSYMLHLVSPGSFLDTPVNYSAPTLRCDNAVGSSSGCVVPDHIPTLNVDSLEFPVAAAGVRWAQNNLAGHPGLKTGGTPLRREAVTARQRANRWKVCDASFTKLSTVPSDSCDEFPFAATKQGGSMNGPDCAEIIPSNNGTVTVLKPAGSTTTCMRAHVPLPQNRDVGGDLGQFVQGQRILDDGPYWVTTD
ncbi:NucA/NucB deoxyribonuclease domain-containing protein [Lentzea sp. CA-135723]|uniref:NucA/NucB deoxyribonuclease domain-containing protein n=1 Tax=Lentzea sp. CA-135723 TaxID=3239950 RepID=UPI003D90B200